MQQSFMKTRPVLPLVLSMSLPMVLSMMVTSLYNIVDSYYVARISEDAMTALSLVFPVPEPDQCRDHRLFHRRQRRDLLPSWRAGRKEGERRRDPEPCVQHAARRTAHSRLHCRHAGFLRLFTTDAQVVDMGVRYSRVAFAFSVFVAASMSMEKIFQAVGRMMLTMICMMSGCVANIILDPVLIFGLGPFSEMGIEGAARSPRHRPDPEPCDLCDLLPAGAPAVRLCFDPRTFEARLTKRMYAVGIPAALNLALPSLLISCLNIILAAFSQVYVLVLGVYYKLQTFLYLPANGIVQGMRPIIGYNYGAGEHARVQKIYRVALALSACIMAVEPRCAGWSRPN